MSARTFQCVKQFVISMKNYWISPVDNYIFFLLHPFNWLSDYNLSLPLSYLQVIDNSQNYK